MIHVIHAAVSVCICMYVCFICMYQFVFVCITAVSVCICMYVCFICMYQFVFVCICMYVYVCTFSLRLASDRLRAQISARQVPDKALTWRLTRRQKYSKMPLTLSGIEHPPPKPDVTTHTAEIQRLYIQLKNLCI